MCSCGRKVKIGLFILAIVLFVVSLIVVFVVVPAVLKSEIEKSVRLENGTKQWDRFVKIPFPLEFKVHIFEIENEDPENMDKPKVKETGPFVYKEELEKYDIKLDSKNPTVSFYQNHKFVYDKEASGGLDEEKTVKWLNLPLMALLQTAENIPKLGLGLNIDAALEEAFEQPKIFIETKAKDVMFDGYKFCDPARLKTSDSKLFCAFIMLMKLKNLRYESDGSIYFSFLNYKKDTHDGYFKLNTGMDDVEDLGQIIEWNNNKYTQFWGKEENECNKITGYDSTIYPPYIEDSYKFDIFSTDICRTVKVNYVNERKYKDIDGYRFELSNNALKVDKPAESCYCLGLTRDMNGEKSCFLDGLMDLHSCFGVPVLLSLPHFLYADEKYQKSIEGTKPNVGKHVTFVEVEPNTGTPLQGKKRVQINSIIRPIYFQEEVVKITEKLPRAVFPMIWLEEGVSLPDKYVKELEEEFFDKVVLLDGVTWTLVALTAVCTFASGLWLFCCKKNHYDT